MSTEKVIDWFECRICLEEFSHVQVFGLTPIIVPCGHNICRRCYEQTHEHETYTCGTCNKVHHIKGHIYAYGFEELMRSLRLSYPSLFCSSDIQFELVQPTTTINPPLAVFTGFNCRECRTYILDNEAGEGEVFACGHIFCMHCTSHRPLSMKKNGSFKYCNVCQMQRKFYLSNSYYVMIEELKSLIEQHLKELEQPIKTESIRCQPVSDETVKCGNCEDKLLLSYSVICKTCNEAPLKICMSCFFKKHRDHEAEDYNSYKIREDLEHIEATSSGAIRRYRDLFKETTDGMMEAIRELEENVHTICAFDSGISFSKCEEKLKIVGENMRDVEDEFEKFIPNLRKMSMAIKDVNESLKSVL